MKQKKESWNLCQKILRQCNRNKVDDQGFLLARLRLQTTMAHVIVLVSPFEWQLKDWLIKEWNTIQFHRQIIVNVNQEEKKVEKMKTLDKNLDKTFISF